MYVASYKSRLRCGVPDWEQGYHEGEIDMLQMQEKAQDPGNQTKRRRASPDWWEEDEHGDCNDGDKKNQKKNNHNNKQRGIFTQLWAERYNMDDIVNLKESPRVEFWVDTK